MADRWVMPTHKDLPPWPVEDEWWYKGTSTGPPRPARSMRQRPSQSDDGPFGLNRRVSAAEVGWGLVIAAVMIAYKYVTAT